MKNYVQKGDTITVASPSNITGGMAVVIGSLPGVAAGDADSGEPLDLMTRGVFELAKVEANAITVGERVYLVGGVAGGLVTDAVGSGANPYLGVAVTAAPNPSATVQVKFG